MNEFRYDALLILTYGGPESPDGVPAYLKRLFKKRFGMTMREWREANREQRP